MIKSKLSMVLVNLKIIAARQININCLAELLEGPCY